MLNLYDTNGDGKLDNIDVKLARDSGREETAIIIEKLIEDQQNINILYWLL